MATDYTPNYSLDLYASTDKPNLRDQYNAAMGKIDTQMKKNADDVTNANANVLTLQTQMTEAQEDITTLESTVETHGTQITTIQNTADGALSLAQTNESDIEDTQADVTSLTSRVSAVEGTSNKNKTDIASLDTRVGVAEGNITEAQNDITEAQSDIDGLQSTVNQKAPINHATTANTYGQGSPTNFGHLKVVDSGSAAASSGTAASPKMVNDARAAMAAVETSTVNGNRINGAAAFDVTMNWNKNLGIANFRFYTGFSQTADLGETRLTAAPFPSNMRPSSNRTLKSYGLASMNSPGGTYDNTNTIPIDLVYKTDGHLYLKSLGHIGSSQWTTISTMQGVLFTQGW